MKHIIQLAGILLLFAAGCRSTDSIEQLQSGRRSDCNVVTILAPSNNAMTRTTLQNDNGTYNIYWTCGDKIGVFSEWTDNAEFTLNTIEQQEEVAFQGTIAGAPEYAYYPYSGEAGNNPGSITMNLPATQEQTVNDSPNMAYDLKAGQKNGGSAASGYTFTFQQKLTLLRFTINPGILLDDVLQSITLTAPSNRKLTGDYTLDITKADAVPSFGNNASNSVTVNFKKPIPISDAVGYAFINPDILKGDALDITINTDKHIISTFTATAGANFVIGKIYKIGIDLAGLESARKVEILQKDSWENMNIPGYYILSEDGAIPIHQYHAGIDQYAWSSSENGYSFRIQSMVKGRLSKMTVPENDAEVNDNVNLTLYTIYGNDGIVETVYSNCLLIRKLRVSDSMVAWWLESSDGNHGFVIWKEDVIKEEE